MKAPLCGKLCGNLNSKTPIHSIIHSFIIQVSGRGRIVNIGLWPDDDGEINMIMMMMMKMVMVMMMITCLIVHIGLSQSSHKRVGSPSMHDPSPSKR